MIGECVVGFAMLVGATEAPVEHWLTLEPRSNLSVRRRRFLFSIVIGHRAARTTYHVLRTTRSNEFVKINCHRRFDRSDESARFLEANRRQIGNDVGHASFPGSSCNMCGQRELESCCSWRTLDIGTLISRSQSWSGGIEYTLTTNSSNSKHPQYENTTTFQYPPYVHLGGTSSSPVQDVIRTSDVTLSDTNGFFKLHVAVASLCSGRNFPKISQNGIKFYIHVVKCIEQYFLSVNFPV